MTPKYTSSLYKSYTDICNEYVKRFCEKHDLDTHDIKDGWVSNDVGTIVLLGDYFISFDDIILDIEEDVPEGKYFEYCDWCLEDGHNWNYKTWLMGGKTIHFDNNQIEKHKKEFEDFLDNYIKDSKSNDCPF